MNTTIIKTDGLIKESNLNAYYDVIDLSRCSYEVTLNISFVYYYQQHGKYPDSLKIYSYNGQNSNSSTVTGLTALDDYYDGDDHVYVYDYNCHANVGGSYQPLYKVTDLKFPASTTKLKVEDVGELCYPYLNSNDKTVFGESRYLHFPKHEALWTGSYNNMGADSWAFFRYMPQYVTLSLRCNEVNISKEKLLELLKYCCNVHIGGTTFKQEAPTPEEIIKNINTHYRASYFGDNSTGARILFNQAPYSEVDPEDVADWFIEEGVYNFRCFLQLPNVTVGGVSKVHGWDIHIFSQGHDPQYTCTEYTQS